MIQYHGSMLQRKELSICHEHQEAQMQQLWKILRFLFDTSVNTNNNSNEDDNREEKTSHLRKYAALFDLLQADGGNSNDLGSLKVIQASSHTAVAEDRNSRLEMTSKKFWSVRRVWHTLHDNIVVFAVVILFVTDVCACSPRSIAAGSHSRCLAS